MDNYRERQFLQVARELALSHGTLFAAAFLADCEVSMSMALLELTRPPVLGIGTPAHDLDRIDVAKKIDDEPFRGLDSLQL